jgi:hypothetical protein
MPNPCCHTVQQCVPRESGEVAMAKFIAANPHVVQAKYILFAKRTAENKKKI